MKTFTLASAVVRGTTWLSTEGIRELGRKGRTWVLPLAGLGILAGVGSMLAFLVLTYSGYLSIGIATGHPELLMFFAVLISWVFALLAGIPLALSALYYSHDTQLLLTLPVNVLILGPALVMFALKIGISVPFLIGGLITLFVSPLVPLSLSVLLVLVLAKVVNLSRFRVILEVVGMALGLVIIVAVQVTFSRTFQNQAQGGTFQALSQLPDFFGALSRALPPVAWAAGIFVPRTAALSALLSVLCPAVGIIAAFLLAPLNFLRDVTERVEMRRESRARSGSALSLPAPRPAWRSLLSREWCVLTSNSTFIFEAVTEMLIMPLLLVIYAFILPKNALGPALAFINTSPLIGLIVMAVLAMMTNMTTISSTSLSREGKAFAISLLIPVKGREQLKAKLAIHLLMFLSAYFVDLAVIFVVFHVSLKSLLFLIPAGPIFSVFGFTTGVFFDLKRPLLKWSHPQQAMKNNMNAMVGMAFPFALIVVLGVPGAFALFSGVDPFLLGCLFPLVPLAMDAVLLPLVFAFADRQYGGGLEMDA
jgi:ABC-2 type transport system permease protein